MALDTEPEPRGGVTNINDGSICSRSDVTGCIEGQGQIGER